MNLVIMIQRDLTRPLINNKKERHLAFKELTHQMTLDYARNECKALHLD